MYLTWDFQMKNYNGSNFMQSLSRCHPPRFYETTLNGCPEYLQATKVAAAYLPMLESRGFRSFSGEER